MCLPDALASSLPSFQAYPAVRAEKDVRAGRYREAGNTGKSKCLVSVLSAGGRSRAKGAGMLPPGLELWAL